MRRWDFIRPTSPDFTLYLGALWPANCAGTSCVCMGHYYYDLTELWRLAGQLFGAVAAVQMAEHRRCRIFHFPRGNGHRRTAGISTVRVDRNQQIDGGTDGRRIPVAYGAPISGVSTVFVA